MDALKLFDIPNKITNLRKHTLFIEKDKEFRKIFIKEIEQNYFTLKINIVFKSLNNDKKLVDVYIEDKHNNFLKASFILKIYYSKKMNEIKEMSLYNKFYNLLLCRKYNNNNACYNSSEETHRELYFDKKILNFNDLQLELDSLDSFFKYFVQTIDISIFK